MAAARRVCKLPRRTLSASVTRLVAPQSAQVVPTGDLHDPGLREVTSETALISGGPSPADVAMPKTPPNVPHEQAPGHMLPWSRSQNPRDNAMRGPRFEQTNMHYQPMPRAAMDLIADEPIRLVDTRIAACDGGGGPLGHPKVFINLDKPGSKACGYCGLRFEREVHAHH